MSKKEGLIYILTNPSFPQFVKIGYTDDIDERLRSLNSSTCIPYSFRLYAYYKTSAKLADLEVHHIIDAFDSSLRTKENVNGKLRVREFYAMSKEDAYQLLKCIAKVNGLEKNLVLVPASAEMEKEEYEAEELRSRPPKLAHIKRSDLFDSGYIKTGDKVFIKNNPTKIGTIVDANKINYDGKTLSYNKFGTLITGWKTIDIYDWLVQKNSGKSLDQLREDYDNEKSASENLEKNKNYLKNFDVNKKPTFTDLVNAGILKIGSALYIKNYNKSESIIIDNSHVKYNGKILTPNAWGISVVGRSNNIYSNCYLKENDVSLDSLRKQMINKALELK